MESSHTHTFANYRAPLIACAIALIVLASIKLVPGVLGYPEDAQGTPPMQNAELLTKVQQARNQQLRESISALEEALQAGMCVADGQFQTPGGPLPAKAIDALPAAPPSITEACAEAADESVTVQALADRATVLVVRLEGSTIKGLGTGFFIRPGEVLTNAHVVQTRDASLRIYSKSLGTAEASVVAMGGPATEDKVDLALLSAPAVQAGSAAVLKFARAERGERVRSVGFPGQIVERDPSFIASLTNPSVSPPSKEPVIGSGEVVIEQNEGPSGTWLYHDAFIDRGNSGGPLIDICGRAVGVNTAFQGSSPETDNAGGYAPAPVIAKALSLDTVEQFFRANGLEPPTISDAALPEIEGRTSAP